MSNSVTFRSKCATDFHVTFRSTVLQAAHFMLHSAHMCYKMLNKTYLFTFFTSFNRLCVNIYVTFRSSNKNLCYIPLISLHSAHLMHRSAQNLSLPAHFLLHSAHIRLSLQTILAGICKTYSHSTKRITFLILL